MSHALFLIEHVQIDEHTLFNTAPWYGLESTVSDIYGFLKDESEPNAIPANFDREEYEVYDYEKRLPKRFISEKSSTSVYIGAPEEFAEWIGYSVDELLNGAAETGSDTLQSNGAGQDYNDGDSTESTDLFARLLGR